uniref:Uncharacterized protein n=1 Tax=Dechloromonas aromatica (strain RCB) TaxID=159087 RepID=Q47GD9_DECAR
MMWANRQVTDKKWGSLCSCGKHYAKAAIADKQRGIESTLGMEKSQKSALPHGKSPETQGFRKLAATVGYRRTDWPACRDYSL